MQNYDQEEQDFHYSVLDVKTAIDRHGVQRIFDMLFLSDTHKAELQNYLTNMANPATIVSVE